MPSSLQLRARIKTSASISQITKAMEAVAAGKMRKAQEFATRGKTYEHLMRHMAGQIMRYSDPHHFPELSVFWESVDLPSLFILISPDRGLAGSLNTNLFRLALNTINETDRVITIGKKVTVFARKTDWELTAVIDKLSDTPTFSDILPASKVAIEEFVKRRVGKLYIIYPQFVSTLIQHPTVQQILPVTPEQFIDEKQILYPKYIFEPSGHALLTELLPAYARLVIFQAVLSMKAAEQSARMIAMKNASENAADVRHYLELLYNQNRQRAITSEIADIVTATLVL